MRKINKKRLIKEAARMYLVNCQIPHEDMMQEGYLAICKAEIAFNPLRGATIEWFMKIVLRNHFLALSKRAFKRLELVGEKELDGFLRPDGESLLSEKFDLNLALVDVEFSKEEAEFWAAYRLMDGKRGAASKIAFSMGVSRQYGRILRDSILKKLRRACERQHHKKITQRATHPKMSPGA